MRIARGGAKRLHRVPARGARPRVRGRAQGREQRAAIDERAAVRAKPRRGHPPAMQARMTRAPVVVDSAAARGLSGKRTQPSDSQRAPTGKETYLVRHVRRTADNRLKRNRRANSRISQNRRLRIPSNNARYSRPAMLHSMRSMRAQPVVWSHSARPQTTASTPATDPAARPDHQRCGHRNLDRA